MTYGQFLVLFLLVPIVVLALLRLRDALAARMKQSAATPQNQAWVVLVALVVVAVVYTVPWDNHLISERVWEYNQALVSRVRLGQIPLEELLFFILQTILIELWILWLMPRTGRHLPAVAPTARASAGAGADAGLDDANTRPVSPLLPPWRRVQADGRSHRANSVRWIAVVAGAVVWLGALALLLRGWRPGTYLAWELAWALPPLIVQLGLGGDMLWRRWRLVLVALVPAVVYLSVADALAIHMGIWTVSPYQSLGFLLGGVLPLEELIFYIVTSTLVTCGVILGVAPEMRRRLHLTPDTNLAVT